MKVKKAYLEEGIFKIFEEKLPSLKEGEVLLKQLAIPLLDLDFSWAKRGLPYGFSALAEVLETSAEVSWLQKGDRVFYCTEPGAFCDYRIVKNTSLVKVKLNCDSGLMALSLFLGTFAHMLLVRTFILNKGHRLVLDRINGALTRTIAWLAKERGAFVVGLEDNNSKKDPEAKFDKLFKLEDEEFNQEYKNTFNVYCHGLGSLPIEAIKPFLVLSGVIVDYSLGDLELKASLLAERSLFFTSPSLLHYKSLREERLLTVNDIIQKLEKNPLSLDYPEKSFSEIQEISEALLQKNQALIIKV